MGADCGPRVGLKKKAGGLGPGTVAFVVGGLTAVVAYNWRRWGQDKAKLAEVSVTEALPALEAWRARPLVSVLVAAWNEADIVERHVESFMGLRYPNKELVLCAGGEDGTYGLAERYKGARVKVLEQLAGEGKQRALARAFPVTRGEIIFLTDADCLLSDEAFERTVYPIAIGLEQVCTGGSRPLPEQLENPFVFSQAANQIYSSFRKTDYVRGLLGRNSAVERDLLELSQGLSVPASSGTDYVLAKMLLRTGARIRHDPHSQVATRYPSTRSGYIGQQRRWLHNVAYHGRRFEAADEVNASYRTSLVGLVMLLLPLTGFLFRPSLLVVWSVLVVQALLARVRYLAFAGVMLNRAVKPADIVLQECLLGLDILVWSRTLLDKIKKPNKWVW